MSEKSLGQVAFDAYKAERKKDPHSNLLAGWPAQYKEEWECAALAVVAAHEERNPREPITGSTSDGYHTFDELYEHRCHLFALLLSHYDSWKSKLHDDGSEFVGWFIAGAELPSGTITYHLPMSMWDLCRCRILDRAPAWDGHTPSDVIARMRAALSAAHESRKWRKVEDGLPPTEEMVLVVNRFGSQLKSVEVAGAYIFEDEGPDTVWCCGDESLLNVTHWMPLPAPPETEGGEG